MSHQLVDEGVPLADGHAWQLGSGLFPMSAREMRSQLRFLWSVLRTSKIQIGNSLPAWDAQATIRATQDCGKLGLEPDTSAMCSSARRTHSGTIS